MNTPTVRTVTNNAARTPLAAGAPRVLTLLAGLSISAAALALSGCGIGDRAAGDITVQPASPSTAIKIDEFNTGGSNAPAPTPNITTTNKAPTGSAAVSPSTAVNPTDPRQPRVEVLTGSPASMNPAANAGTSASAKSSSPALNPSMTTAIGQDAPKDIRTDIGKPPAPDANASAIGDAAVVDTLVGQVNGKPIYASKFLADQDDRLRAMAKDAGPNRGAWLSSARKIIADKLEAQLQDELFISEGRSVLSPTERKGLIHFLGTIREGLVSQYGGSTELANVRLNELEEGGLDFKANTERDKALIGLIYQRYIVPRVNISWKEVQREYERRWSEFNPWSVAHYRMIQVPRTDTERVEKIKSALATRSFIDVASDATLNEYVPSRGGKIDVTVQNREYAKATLFSGESLNTAAQGLSNGGTAGPIEDGRNTTWIMLEQLEPKPGKPLEEVQLQVFAKLQQYRLKQETERYYSRLRAKGSTSDLQQMAQRILQYAEQRYFPMKSPAAQPPSSPTPLSPAKP